MEGGGVNYLLFSDMKDSFSLSDRYFDAQRVRLVPGQAKSWMRYPLYLNAVTNDTICFTSQYFGDDAPIIPTIDDPGGKRYGQSDHSAQIFCGNKEMGFKASRFSSPFREFLPRNFTVAEGKLWFLFEQLTDRWWLRAGEYERREIGSRHLSCM